LNTSSHGPPQKLFKGSEEGEGGWGWGWATFFKSEKVKKFQRKKILTSKTSNLRGNRKSLLVSPPPFMAAHASCRESSFVVIQMNLMTNYHTELFARDLVNKTVQNK
jgi:hypothetical protein